MRKSPLSESQLGHSRTTSSFGMPTSEAHKGLSTKVESSTWNSSSHWAILTIHLQSPSSIRSPIPMCLTTIFAWIWSDRTRKEKKDRDGHQLTVFRVFWLNCRASYLKRISAKTKRLSNCKPRKQWKKPTLSNAEIVSMEVNCLAGLPFLSKKRASKSSKH